MNFRSIGYFLAIIFALRPLFFSGPDTLREDLGEILLGLVLGLLVAFVGLNKFGFHYIQNNYGGIRKELRFLDALSKDFQNAHASVDQIKQRANQAWDSQVLNLRQITQTLSEAESHWVMGTGDLSFEARRCTDEFENEFHNYGVKASFKVLDLAFGMVRANRAIDKYRNDQGRGYANGSIRLLEKSRLKVRRLQDRPIGRADDQPARARTWQPLRSGLALVLRRLVDSKLRFTDGTEELIRSAVMQLQLLRALAKDLRGVALESEMEEVWLDEAGEIVERAQKDIGAFLQEAAYRNKNLSRVTDYLRYRPKFGKVMKNVGDLLARLLEVKERYGFNFIKRGLSADSSPRMDNGNGDHDIIPQTINSIFRDLLENELQGQGTSNVPRFVNAVLMKLRDLGKILKDQEATEGATHTKLACFSILRKMCSDIANFVENSQWNEIKKLQETASLLERCIQAYRVEVMRESCPVVGLEEDKNRLISMLTGTDDQVRDPLRPIVSVVGMRGVGKTTLAKEICNHKSVVDYFAVCCLVSIPEEIGENELLQTVGNKITQTQETRNEREFWINKLQGFMKNRKALVVLDNLSSANAWDILKPALFPDGSASTVMLVMRDKVVASRTNSSCVHRLRLRTAKESWEFFTQMVDCPEDIEVQKLAKKVVARTGGLPLAIQRLGYLLSGKKVTKDELLVVLERVSQGQNQTPWDDNLKTNIADLQAETVLDNCLSYFQLFPSDFEIPTRRLVAIWVARGIVPKNSAENANESEQGRIEERVAYECLLDLIDRNMIQTVEQKPNGKVMTCRFPSVLRERWLRSRPSSDTARSWSWSSSFGNQVAFHFDGDDDGSYSRVIHNLDSNVLREDSYPFSVTFFDSREGNRPGEDVLHFLEKGISSRNFRGLLVLDLESVYKPRLPSNIGKLNKLKYLGLRWTKVETLPSSIGQLSNLQTLDLKETSLRTLPRSVWKLKKLRNLHLNRCRIEVMPDPRDISMKNLHKLSGVFVDNESRALIDSLHKLSNLRKLRLTFQLTLLRQEELARNIPKLTQLRSLSLRSVNENEEAQDLKLEHLSSLQNLSSLYLFGKLENLCVVSQLPGSLNELTLSASRLSQGSVILRMLAALPELKFLSFFSDSYVDTELVFPQGGFPKLLDLKIWNLDNLKKLNVEEGAMTALRKFEIRECRNLKVTRADTTGLKHLRSLLELKLTDMPQGYGQFVKDEFARAKIQNPERVLFPAIKT